MQNLYETTLLADAQRKFIVFARHRAILDLLEEFVVETLRLGTIRIDGQTPSTVRQNLCDQFQNKPDVRCAVLSIEAAGQGLTLTAADLILFAELTW